MDMLSVLLHEYGHALGIDHHADSHNYMGTTLTPGMRRMPSAEELALMQQLIGEQKDEMLATATLPTTPANGGDEEPLPLPVSLGGLAFAGLMRNRYGAMSTDLASALAPSPAPSPQYAVAANATFTALDTPTGWLTQGDVVIDTVIDPSIGSGQGYSNLATVSLTITAVNDAPVAADAALTTAEDTALVVTLGAYASDVDSAWNASRE